MFIYRGHPFNTLRTRGEIGIKPTGTLHIKSATFPIQISSKGRGIYFLRTYQISYKGGGGGGGGGFISCVRTKLHHVSVISSPFIRSGIRLPGSEVDKYSSF